MPIATIDHKYKCSLLNFGNKEIISFSDESENDLTALDIGFSNSIENKLQNFIGRIIAEVSEVEYIYCCREGQVNCIWVFINELDPEVRREVYKKEIIISDLLPEEVFDFHVIARRNKPVQSIFRQDGIELVYKKSNR